MSLIRPNRIGRRWIGQPLSTPRALFGNAEAGVFLDFSDPRSLYADASGTIPVTAPDTPIRLAADKSRTRSPITAYAAMQASTGLAPRYGRAPMSRRQLLQHSSDLSQASAWGGSGITVTAAPDTLAGQPFNLLIKNNSTAARARSQTGFSTAAGQSYTCTVALLAGTSTAVDVGIGPSADGGGSIWGGASVTVTVLSGPGAAINSGGSGLATITGLSATVPTLVKITRSYANSGIDFGVVIYPDGSSSTVSGASVKVALCQLERGTLATPYQKTTTAYDMTEAGVPSFGYARFDLVDDVLSAVMALAQTGDVLLFGRGGSWIEPGRVFAAGSNFQVGVTGTAITPGILRALGDLVGIVAIGRTLSAADRNRALRYFQVAGAAGWLTPGVSTLPNGGFATGANWYNASTGAGTAVISGGVATLTGVDASNRGRLTADQITGAAIGQPYLLTWDVVSGTANSQITIGSGGTVLDMFGAVSPGAKQAVFIAGSSAIDMSINVYGAGTVVFDNVAIRPLTAGA